MKSDINKQFLLLDGSPILAHTISKFKQYKKIAEIVTVLRMEDFSYFQNNILNKYKCEDIKVIAGGKTRRESVYAGILSFSPAIDYVIIHDGARPLVSKNLIIRVIEAMEKFPAITTGVPAKDTIKYIDKDLFVKETLNRDKLYYIQTPQAFRYDILKNAHEKVKAEINITDDASLVEMMGQKVKIIDGDYENIKITTPIDLKMAEFLLSEGKE